MDMIAAAFQKASESGVAHIPTTTMRNAEPMTNVLLAATLGYRPRLASTEGGRANKQNPARNSAVDSNRPLVLVYSPRKAMASTMSTRTGCKDGMIALVIEEWKKDEKRINR